MDINEIVNLGVSVCLNVFFIKYFFSEHKKMTDNISKLVEELKDMKTCVNNVDCSIKDLKKAG